MTNLQGAKFALIATVFFTVLNALVKEIGQTLPLEETVFFRFLIAYLVILPLTPKSAHLEFFKKDTPRYLHLFRAGLGVTAILCCFFGMTRLPLSEAMSLTYTAPLLVAILGQYFLRERVPPLRWPAIACGAAGVLIICRPKMGAELMPVAVMLAGSLARAGSDILARALSSRASSQCLVVSFLGLGSIMIAPFAIANWQTPTSEQWLVLLLLGVSGGFFQIFLTRAFQLSPASALAPFFYTSLLWAVLLGALFWNEVPGQNEILGSALIVLDGFLALWTLRTKVAKPLAG